MLNRGKRYIGLFAIILLLISAYLFLTKEDHKREMGQQNRYELGILNGLTEKKLFFRDSLKYQMDSVMLQLHKNTQYSDKYRYYTNRRMLQKAQMFSYDYASQFSHKMCVLSDRIGDENMIAESRILSSFYLAQACLFVEALDTLKSVRLDSPNLNDSILALYYFYNGITYQRLAVYASDSVNAQKYNNIGNEMFLKSLDYSDNDGVKNFAQGRIYGRRGQFDVAQRYFEKSLEFISRDDNILYTLANASLGKCFKHQGLHEEATRYYIEATKNDILNAQNSSIAIIDLTEHIFKQYHQMRDVIRFLNLAIENGEYYGMRSQITHIDKIVPDISEEKLSQMRILICFFVTIIATFLIYILYTLFRNEKNRKQLESYLSTSEKVKEENSLLREENERLSRTSMLLRDSNKLKDAYLGKLLESNSELTNMFEEFAIKADQKLRIAQYEQIQKSIRELQKCFSKKEQLDRFDELFMSMFPTFITDFNALLMPEHRKQESEALLTPSMRIFALIRLGITSNQQIARVLNYTYNTILNYRVRVRAMAINPDTFEQDVTKIGLQ